MKKALLWTGVCILAICCIVLIVNLNAISSTADIQADVITEKTKIASKSPYPLSLEQVWDLTMEYADRWDKNARIASLGSIGAPSPSSCQDGKQQEWQAVLISSQAELWLTIKDGVIIEEVRHPVTGTLLPIEEKPLIDSRRLLDIVAQRHPDILNQSGCDFIIENTTSLSAPMLRLLGMMQGKRTLIEVNPYSGDVISSKKYILKGGGVLFSHDRGQTWNPSNLSGLFVGNIETDPWKNNQAYAIVSQNNRSVVYSTEDYGETWNVLSLLPEQAGDWPRTIQIIGNSPTERAWIVTTESGGAWHSSDGKNWAKMTGLPDGTITWSAVTRSENRYRIFFSISGNKAGVYAGRDLGEWEKITEGNYRFSLSFDQTQAIATSGEGKQGWLLAVDGQEEMMLPENVLRVAGDFSDSFVVYSMEKGAGIVKAGDSATQWTLNSYLFSSLAAAPDYPDSHLLIAGCFRDGGILRSMDGGVTWQQVLVNPNALITGSNEMAFIRFLSPTDILIVNGGYLVWEDF